MAPQSILDMARVWGEHHSGLNWNDYDRGSKRMLHEFESDEIEVQRKSGKMRLCRGLICPYTKVWVALGR